MSVKNMLFVVIILCIIWLALSDLSEPFEAINLSYDVALDGDCRGDIDFGGVPKYGSTNCQPNFRCVNPQSGMLVYKGESGKCKSCTNGDKLTNDNLYVPFVNSPPSCIP
jgi:hypothetical protein